MRRHKHRGKRGPLSLKERLLIIQKVICDKLSQPYVAREMKVSQGTISRIVSKANKRPEVIHEMIEKRDEE